MNKKLVIPAGVIATFSLAVVPLGVFNVQYLLGYAPDTYRYVEYHQLIDWYWIPMEAATLFVGAILLYLYRLPFLVFIVAMTLWYLSMDLWPLLSQARIYDFQDRAVFSMCFGFLMIATTIYADFKWESRQDYLFWLYIVGVIVFWGGLSCQYSTSEFGRFIYFLVNLSLILASALLNRRVFAVFGAFGVFGYLGHLSYSVFANSLGFPFALIVIGLLIIFSGIKWPVFSIWFIQKMTPYLPEVLLKRLKD